MKELKPRQTAAWLITAVLVPFGCSDESVPEVVQPPVPALSVAESDALDAVASDLVERVLPPEAVELRQLLSEFVRTSASADRVQLDRQLAAIRQGAHAADLDPIAVSEIELLLERASLGAHNEIEFTRGE
jgi:hypothetical protein